MNWILDFILQNVLVYFLQMDITKNVLTINLFVIALIYTNINVWLHQSRVQLWCLFGQMILITRFLCSAVLCLLFLLKKVGTIMNIAYIYNEEYTKLSDNAPKITNRVNIILIYVEVYVEIVDSKFWKLICPSRPSSTEELAISLHFFILRIMTCSIVCLIDLSLKFIYQFIL